MLLLAHPLGNANVRQAALAFAEGGTLAEFWTCLHWNPETAGAFARFLLPARLRAQLARRAFPTGVSERIHLAATAREACRHLAARGGAATRWLMRHERGPCSVDAVFRAFDRAVARRLEYADPAENIHAVYAYEDGAAETFRVAKERGLRRLYDLPIGYWRAGHAIFAEEAEREPEWAPTLTGRADSARKLARKDEELARADVVFVASSFTRETLRKAPDLRAPVHVIPYGAPEPISDRELDSFRETDGSTRDPRPLRVLFAGSLGQRKGLSYLLEAVTQLGRNAVELTLLGHKTVENCPPLERAVRAHRWILSLPHAGVLDEMARQDVLVFPSLFEGFGLVLLEAMSRGLPVIATAHTAAPDLLSADGVEGFLVPVRSAEAIEEKLETLHRDRARLAAMRRAALARAATLRWADYRRELRAHAAASGAPAAMEGDGEGVPQPALARYATRKMTHG